MMNMKRRAFLRKSLVAGAAGLLLPTPKIFGASAEGYSGPLLVTLQVDGGWDVTSFCDPKMNVSGERDINNWANSAEIQTAGNIKYAPIAGNAGFFDTYYQDMLIINGVDSQTNSHTTGVLHNWSGRNSEGYPSLTAMFAAHHAPGLPLSYINSGGFAETADLIRFSRLDSLWALNRILIPERRSTEDQSYLRSPEDMTRIREYRRLRNSRILARTDLLARERSNLDAYESSLESKVLLSDFENFLPSPGDVFPEDQVNGEVSSNLKRQIQMAIATFEAGIGSAADLVLFGFDTHNDHDTLHEPLLQHLTESIDLLWTSAETAGIADRMTLVVGSDFSRTPHYNSENGKDHWPIGSFMVMQRGASWGNRVAGLTDEGHNAYQINPNTLERDDSAGTIIYPAHVHKAIRRLLGLENTSVDTDFQFAATEDFAFFD